MPSSAPCLLNTFPLSKLGFISKEKLMKVKLFFFFFFAIDQRGVLQKAKHVVVIGDVSLTFTVRDVQMSSLAPSQTNSTPGQVDGSKRDTAASPKVSTRFMMTFSQATEM